ncbi:MAG: helix-turn-helix domain-containing protein [Patescibacteria group bacterium]
MIEKLLEELGFDEKEIRVYLAVLQKGKTTPAAIARLTGINRSTVYSVAKELLEKGVIQEDLAGPQAYLIALPPQDLANLGKREERKLTEKKALIAEAIKELEVFSKNTPYSIPKISFIYEEDIEAFLYKQTAEWNRSIMATDGTWWGYQDPTFVKYYEKWIDWYWKESCPPDLVLKLLSSEHEIEGKMAKKEYDRRLIRFWKKGKDVTATTWITGDYMIMVVTRQKPHYLVQIHDATLAHNMREILKGIWEEKET